MPDVLKPKTPPPPDRRFHGRRKGKRLNPGRAALLETLLPKLAVSPPPEGTALDPAALFPADAEGRPVREVWLEVGFGGGEHLAAQAEANPRVGILGAEVFVNGIASLLRHVKERGLTNVRIHPEDVRALFPALPDACFTRIFVLFPDPWPKRRHAPRRFIGPDNLDALSRLLADDGELRVASDDMGYIRWSLRHLTAHPDFVWTAQGPGDWRTRPADSAPTRYEAKALRAGRRPVHLSFRRRAREN